MKINTYKSVREAYIHPDDIVDVTFEEFVEFATASQTSLEQKESGQLFNLCSFIDNPEAPSEDSFNPDSTPHNRIELIRRCKANVKEIYALLLDVDGNLTLAEAVAKWHAFEFFVYSTHGNSTEKEKFRLVMPLSTPITRDAFDERHTSLCEFFGVDKASFTISQAFYWPSYSPANADIRFAYYNKGEVQFDAMLLPAEEISNIAPAPVYAPGEKDPMATAIYDTFLTGGNLRYADALTLAVICKSKGIIETDWRNLVQRISGADSSLRNGEADLNNLWKDAYTGQIKNDTVLKLMQTLGCDMWRWKK